MTDNRTPGFCGKNVRRDNVCTDTMQILDSCRDKDCYEDVRVYLTDFGQDVIEKTGNIKVKDTKILGVNMQADPVRFNCGFYQITCRVYTKIDLEACLCPGKTQEFSGVAATEKKVVLYGGEGGARVFKSSEYDDGFCPELCDYKEGSNKPTVVLETVDPIALSVKVKEKCRCGCGCIHSPADELPRPVQEALGGVPIDLPALEKNLYVSLGFFSVIRVERPGQFIFTGEEYCVPDKICPASGDDDPLAAFERMAFPSSQFCPAVSPAERVKGASCSCGS